MTAFQRGLNPKRLDTPWSSAATTSVDCTFQQLAPYIGRIKTAIARYLIETYTRPDDVVLDPFAGSGVIPFEAALLGRRAIASDISPYAYLLTSAKLGAPENVFEALERFELQWKKSLERRSNQDLRRVPLWVRKFFHPETLRNALALRDELVANDDRFLLACLLGILHHQRPGFLSYPSSHLVPYLRTKLFPRANHPALYRERDVYPRMTAKILRTYRRPPGELPRSDVSLCDSRDLKSRRAVDAIITSPPYMNELDYVRDNRLRLWFLTRKLNASSDPPRRSNREELFCNLIVETFRKVVPRLRPGGHVIMVVGDTRRGTKRVDAATLVQTALESSPFHSLSLCATYEDTIPDVRRARRDLSGTKRETILVFKKVAARRVIRG